MESVSEEDIWQELEKYFYPPRLQGDLDAVQIMERFGCGRDTAKRKMQQLAESDEYEILMVRGAHNKEMWVLRAKN